jgi:hypothetical protein
MKLCKKDGCSNPVFSHLYCRNHQYLRTDDKKPKGLNKYREPTGEAEIFEEIWNERPHKSEISGRDVGCFEDFMFPNLFAHVLPKGKYPKFRLRKDNIMILNPREHLLIDMGTQAQRDAYEKENNCSFRVFYERQEQLKQEYNQL